jgi:hypothetical protein
MIMRNYLLVTGFGAFIALTSPKVVTYALIFVLPGLVLVMMPTAFMYGLAFATFRGIFSTTLTKYPALGLAALASLASLFAIPQFGQFSARARVAEAKQMDVRPSKAIMFKGNVLLERSHDTSCDGICVALLKVPDVNAVRITAQGRSATYLLVSESVAGKRVEPERYGLQGKSRNLSGARELNLQQMDALSEDWKFRTSKGMGIIQSKVTSTPDFVLKIDDQQWGGTSERWSLAASDPHLQGLTISDSSGRPMFRKVLASAVAPAAPIWIGAGGYFPDIQFGWGTTRVGEYEFAISRQIHEWLRANTNLKDDHNLTH